MDVLYPGSTFVYIVGLGISHRQGRWFILLLKHNERMYYPKITPPQPNQLFISEMIT